jgi:hypothetical protein
VSRGKDFEVWEFLLKKVGWQEEIKGRVSGFPVLDGLNMCLKDLTRGIGKDFEKVGTGLLVAFNHHTTVNGVIQRGKVIGILPRPLVQTLIAVGDFIRKRGIEGSED